MFIRTILRGALATVLLGCSAALHAEHYTVPLFVAAGSGGDPQGVLRLVSEADTAATVAIHAIDDAGVRIGPATLALNALSAVELSATELQSGNAAKGLSAGLESLSGEVRLLIDSDVPIVPSAYVRGADGTLSAMNDTLLEAAGTGQAVRSGRNAYRYDVAVFHPASNVTQPSHLRLINPGDAAAQVTIAARDDTGAAATGGTVELTLPAGGARTLSATQLEAGDSSEFTGRLGAGVGNWRLSVISDRPIQAVNITVGADGEWRNLSTTAVSGWAPETAAAFEARFLGRTIVSRNGQDRATFQVQANNRLTHTYVDDGVEVRQQSGYEYERTGRDAGLLRLDYDAGLSCEARFHFGSRRSGWYAFACVDAEARVEIWTGATWLSLDAEATPLDLGSGPDELVYVEGTAIEALTLPAAIGGDGELTYSLAPQVPGLSFDPDTRRLSGTPAEPGIWTMTYRVRNASGDTDWLYFVLGVDTATVGRETTHTVGATLSDLPSDSWTPDVTSNGSFSVSGGDATVRLDEGGYIEKGGHRYTCESSGGCVIENRRVTSGTVVQTASGTAPGGGVSGDHGNDRATATGVGVGSDTEGVLDAGDVDYFRVVLDAPGTLEVYSSGDIDTVGRLVDADGAVVAENDDGGTSDNFRISEDVSSGTYYVRVAGWSSLDTGNYTLHVRFDETQLPAEGSLGDCQVGMVLSSPQSCRYPGTTDEFSVNVRGRGSFLGRLAGIRIRINNETINGRVYDFEASHQGDGVWRIDRVEGSTQPPTGGGGETTFAVGATLGDLPSGFWTPDVSAGGVTFSSSGGNVTLRFNDGGYIEESGQRFTCQSSGGCVIENRRVTSGTVVQTASGTAPGGGVPGDHGDDRATATGVEAGSDTEGVLDAGDVDYFRVVVDAAGTLEAYTSGRTDTLGRLEDADGAELGTNDDGGAGTNFRISEDVSPGTYFVRVEGHSSRVTGDYTLHVRFTESDSGQGTDDRAALITLYNATDGPNWAINENWGSDAPLDRWYGVITDDNGRVTGIYLADNQLSGSIPAELSGLSNLLVLFLNQNQLSGPIPIELGNLSNLEVLHIYGNQLSGPIPVGLGNLSNLEGLRLDQNQLSGPIPAELGGLSNLVGFTLSDNQLSGPIPAELGSLSNLEHLSLYQNQLSGSIPDELGNLSQLEVLSLWWNQLSGSIPVELGNLSNLEELSLSGNHLSGSIPAELGSLSNLTYLWLGGGNQFSGCIPDGLRDVANNDLSALSLSYCGDSGTPGGGQETTHGVGDTLSDLPSGSWTPDVTSGGSFSLSGGNATVRLNDGGYIEEGSYRYTCQSSGGCVIENRRVTSGTVVQTASGSAPGVGDSGAVEPVERLTNHDARDTGPSWSPAGESIAFDSERDNRYAIYVMDADGSKPRRLTGHDSVDYGPSWSPDGQRIALYSLRDSNWDIYVVDADGGNPQRLTNHHARDEHPSWSPNGQSIAFASNRDGNFEIYVMDADGGNLRRLTDHDSGDGAPSWSPDGQRIAFHSNRGGNYDIYVMDVDDHNGNPWRLTDFGASSYQPSWSPNGQRIVFTSNRDDNSEIYAMDADGGNLRRLTNDGSRDRYPSWSPDGRRIAFASDRDGNWEVYVMEVPGSDDGSGTGQAVQPSFAAGNGPGDQSYTVGTAISALTLPAASGGAGALTYSLWPEVPGLVFNVTASVRWLSGTPSMAGTYNMSYRVRDTDGDTDTLTITITVAEPASEPDLVVESVSVSDSSPSAESISLTASSSAGTYYFGAFVDSVAGESETNNNCSAGVRVSVTSGETGGGNGDCV